MHCLHLVSHEPNFQNRTYNGYNENKIAMTNIFHIADFENAFWSIFPGVALYRSLYEVFTLGQSQRKYVSDNSRLLWG